MFNNDLTEKARRVIPLPLVDASTLGVILDYMYTEDITINRDNAENIFTAASVFIMPELQKRSARFMARELHISNCLSLFRFASLYNFPELEGSAKQFCTRHFRDLLDEEDLMLLDSSDLAKLLQSDELNIKQEQDVAKTIIKWLEWDIENRKPSSELLQCLRLPLLSDNFIKSVLHTNEILMNCVEFQTMLTDMCTQIDSDESLQRLGMYARDMLVFVSGGCTRLSRALGCYDPQTKKNYWAIPMHSGFDFKSKIDFHRIVVTGLNEIYLSGGVMYEDYISNEFAPALDTLHRFNPHEVLWESLPNMTVGRCAHGFVNVDHMLYVIGGKHLYPKGKPLASVHRYDTEDEQWDTLSPMPIALFNHAAVVHGNKILVLGGSTTDDIAQSDGNPDVTVPHDYDVEIVSKVCFEYDITTDVWTRFSGAGQKMYMPRCQFGATICNDELYVVGGSNGQHKLSTVEVYNFNDKKWHFETDFPEDRKCMRAISMNGCVYVCGGVRSIISRMDQAPRVVEARDLWKYNPKTKKWAQEVRLMQYANIHACVVADMNIKMLHPSDFVSSLARRRQTAARNE